MNEDENDKVNEVVKKYVEVTENKDVKFDKMTILLPEFIYDLVNENSKDIGQVKMSMGIFITLIVNDYFEYIQKLYDIEPSLYNEERQKYVRKQLPLTIINETSETIEEIKKLISTSDKVGVIKSSIEHYIKTQFNNILKEPILQDDD